MSIYKSKPEDIMIMSQVKLIALCKLLIEKGIITEDEYNKKIEEESKLILEELK
ncbi:MULTISPECIES: hypothetical protein [Clostridium]|uniref:hypothetical protein n=1 Tax=Clostridium TaxID=1485 RepID=UPI00137AFE07|nr:MULTISPECIES: hypothetical protein [Clostridium]MDU2680065.1 hypothetical protein [Clostridium sp.]DAO81091.1 MAG TPA: Nitrile hydratase beta subunit [Caudoviricetes sp.]